MDQPQPTEERDTTIKRMKRGFKVMYDKICNSNFVKNIQEQNNNADSDTFMPNLPTEKLGTKKEIKNSKKEEQEDEPDPDEFSTDMNKVGGVKL